MKKSIFIFFSLVFIFISITCDFTFASAESVNYYRITSNKAIFYSDNLLTNPVFILPYSYYVKILDESQDYYHIEYSFSHSSPSIDGYVEKSNITNDKTTTDSPFLTLSIKVENTTILYSNYQMTKQVCYVFYDKYVNFIGKSIDSYGNPLYFVCYDNKIGYIKSNDIKAFTIPLHPNAIVNEEKSTDTVADDTSNQIADTSGLLILKIIILLCILLAISIFVIILAQKRKIKHKSPSYYEEKDY